VLYNSFQAALTFTREPSRITENIISGSPRPTDHCSTG